MSDSSASAIAEMRRMLIDQQQTIVGLRSQLIDHRCVVVQTLARVELLENYAENAHGGFQRRYPSAAIFELRNVGRSAPVPVAPRGGNNGAWVGVPLPAAPGGEEAGPSTSNHVNDENADPNGGQQITARVGNNGAWFNPNIDRTMNRARRRLLTEENDNRNRERDIIEQRQQQQREEQQQQQPAEEVGNQQQPEVEMVGEQAGPALPLRGHERRVRLQLREAQRFQSGAPSSVMVPPPRLFRTDECIICCSASANFYSPPCGHIFMCGGCAVTAVLHKTTTCMICRAQFNGVYPFLR